MKRVKKKLKKSKRQIKVKEFKSIKELDRYIRIEDM